MFSLQDLCRKNLFTPLEPLGKHVVQRLGLYWEGHGSLKRMGHCFVCVDQIHILPINLAIKIAAAEGNEEIVKLLLLWGGNLHYAIIGALESRQYELILIYENQIGDYHDILSLIRDPVIYERCHELNVTCTFQCLFQHAIRHNMVSILQKYREDLANNRRMIQLLYEMACRLQNYDIITWIARNWHVFNIEAIFSIAFIRKDLTLYSLGYMFLLDRMSIEDRNFKSIITHHLEYAAKKGLFDFVLESLKYGGQVDTVLFQAVKYNHRKILAYFIHETPRKTVEKLLLHAVESRASKKTINLLLSSLNYSIHSFIKKLLYAVVKHKYMLVIKLLLARPKKKLNLVDAVLYRLVKHSTNAEIVKFMNEFSVSPERVIKVAARLMRVDLIKKISKDVWENKLERIKHLKQIVYTMKHRNGKNLLMYNIYNVTGYTYMNIKEAFNLTKFYAVHNATCLFKEMCKNCFVHDLIQLRELLEDCLHIANKHAYIQIAEAANEYIKYIDDIYISLK
ncbi:MGF 505-9R [African swine fever virus]|nr:MGF 505-9R [African swine fever virus]